ncbi:hypothetical protein [Campylobacter helveticus]|uniref:hypothetical protein n=1 Tax=Campylobacter helveticus TaxID=28898 RepID=UPI0022EB1481|nr:hypothetical protein [Campylobacter helveticus]
MEKHPYTNEEEIGQLFSHLAHIDKMQQEKSISEGKICNKFIKLKFNYPNPDNNGKGETEELKISLGQGHFSKGLNHLREIGRTNLEQKVDKRKEFFDNLSKKYDEYLKIPTKIGIDTLQKTGWGTMETCAKIVDIVPSPELQELLKGLSLETKKEKNNSAKELSQIMQNFLKEIKQEKNQTLEQNGNANSPALKENAKEKATKTNELIIEFSEDDKNKMREEAREVVKKNPSKASQKEYELSNNKGIGVGR